MNRIKFRRVCAAVFGAAALGATLAPLTAQDRVTVPVDDSSTPTPSVELGPRLVREATWLEAEGTFFSPVGHDDPDFRPMEDVFDDDGNVVGTRPVGDPYTLEFPGGAWKPEPGVDPRLEAALRRDPGATSFVYVMVEGRLADAAKRAAFEARGGQLLGIHTWQSWVARVPHGAVKSVAGLPFVRWIGYPQDGQKLEPRLAERLADATDIGPIELIVSVHASDRTDRSEVVEVGNTAARDPDAQEVEAARQLTVPGGPIQVALEDRGLRFEEYHEVGNVFVFYGSADRDAIARLAAFDSVAFLELRLRPELQDDSSMSMIGVDRVRGSYGGSGITVGVVDTGVQGGSGRHLDLNKNFVGWSNVPGGSAFEDGHGHGTHVTGTVGGSGSVDARYRGAAPDIGDHGYSRVFIGRYFDNAGAPHGSFASLFSAMSNDFTWGGETSQKPPVINNSWGTPPSVDRWYGTEAAPRIVDGYVYDHRQLHVFAAGNRGVGVLLEGTSKNCLTVGSVQDYSASGATVGTMSGFSQSGTRDGRRKPEVVAPGSLITSTSNASQSGYLNKAGTSMAAPHVTGALSGLIDHYTTSYNLRPQNLKAVAAATAEWLSNPGSSSGWFGSQGGFGMINAYRMHWSSSNWTLWNGTRSTPLSNSGDWAYWEIQFPSDTEAMKAVVTWIEPAPSAGATRARVNDVRCYVDVEPFSSAGNAGEYAMGSSVENMLSLASRSSTFLAAVRGKRVRFKVYGQSVSSDCYPALSVVAYRDDTYVSGPSHSLSVSDTLVRPRDQLTATARIQEVSGLGEFETARIMPDFGSFGILEMARSSADGDRYRYAAGSSYPSSPYPTPTGEVVLGRGTSRSVDYTLRAPSTSGSYTLRTTAGSYPVPQPATDSVTVCVDGLAPRSIGNLRSTTHTPDVWSNRSTLRFAWNAASDSGCAGLDGLAYQWGVNNPPDPNSVNLSASATTASALAADTTGSSSYTFKLRGIDNAGNRGAVASVGPFKIDTTDPTATSIRIENGASHTSSLLVDVHAVGTDATSGVVEMRFLANDSNWGPWRSYTIPATGVDLSANGGNVAEGTKRLFVQFRDRAANVSASLRDTITYLRAPLISGTPVRTTETVGNTPLVLTGTDFLGVEVVRLGNRSFQDHTERGFADGWFEILSDTRMEVHVPQGMRAGSYSIRLQNDVGWSNARSVQLVYPTTRKLATARNLAVGDGQVFYTHHGGAAGNVTSYLVLSPFRSPSVLPGILNLDIGLNFASYFLIEPAVSHDATTGAAQIGPLTVGAPLRGATWYAQAMQIDLSDPGAAPIPVTNVRATTYR